MKKGNASCHTSNDKFREGYDNMSWDNDITKITTQRISEVVEYMQENCLGLPYGDEGWMYYCRCGEITLSEDESTTRCKRCKKEFSLEDYVARK